MFKIKFKKMRNFSSFSSFIISKHKMNFELEQMFILLQQNNLHERNVNHHWKLQIKFCVKTFHFVWRDINSISNRFIFFRPYIIWFDLFFVLRIEIHVRNKKTASQQNVLLLDYIWIHIFIFVSFINNIYRSRVY